MSSRKRRDFIKRSATTLLGITVIPRSLLGGPGFVPPSDRITKGVIGAGAMGRLHIGYEGTPLVALCDVDSRQLSEASSMVRPGVKLFDDFRELLARSDVDVVHIATPPHWHSVMACMAAEAGKDIWLEVPMALAPGHSRAVMASVRKYGRVFRVNSNSRFSGRLFDNGASVRDIKRVVDSGVLGWPLKVTLNGATGFPWHFGRMGGLSLSPEPVPEELNWEMWLGPAPYSYYNRARTHGRFRGYWDYGAGVLGERGFLYLDAIQYIIGKDGEAPVRVEVTAPPQHHDVVGRWERIVFIYSDGCSINIESAAEAGEPPFIEGPEGKLFRHLRSDIPDIRRATGTLPEPLPMISSFSESVRTRRPFGVNEVTAHYTSLLVNMAATSLRLGRPLDFDPVKDEFTDREAERVISRPQRPPWNII